MRYSKLFTILSTTLTLAIIGAADLAGQDPKGAIKLPKDPKAVVISYDPGAGGFIRKGESPYLKIQADGSVTVTSLFDGSKKETKMPPEAMQKLLGFIVKDNDFFNLNADKIKDAIAAEVKAKGIGIAVGGAGTSVFSVNANGKKHDVTYRAAAAYSSAYPDIKSLKQLAAVEKKLNEFAAAVGKKNDAKVEITRAQIKVLSLAADAYAVKNNLKYPETLDVLVTDRYLQSKDVLLDPWRQVYRYDPTGPKNKGLRPDIWTVTPGFEVIGNWK